ncbi:MAG: hypothetical protein M3186_05815 [Actinomycetota bacterium]|nr:hypothetical protein [Actinomycetota bacterium]
MGDLLAAEQWQGISAILSVAIAAATWWEAHRSRKRDIRRGPSPEDGGVQLAPPTVVRRLGGALLVFVATYVLFAGIWAVFNLVLYGETGPVLQLGFVMFAAPPGFLALVMRWPFVGGFLGGAVPLSLFALYYSQEFIRDNPDLPPPFAWFVVFFLLGGMIGALTGGSMVIAARSLGIPLPRNYRRDEH